MDEINSLEEAKAHFSASAEPVKCRFIGKPTVGNGTARMVDSLADAKRFFKFMEAGPQSTNEIILYFHCAKCMPLKPSDVTPSQWSQLESGWTPHGLQVWCKRCNCNVIHINFEGCRHPSNDRRVPTEFEV